ncbi:hypothetical protein DMUE_3015 [Dictyocoela muelleri]|nr:hypothetical protein DMUE_3015 [Dictyocoela muelleri]
MRIILQYSSRQSIYSINESLYVSKPVVLSIINKLIHQIPANDFSNDKLAGRIKIVQVYETMLNFKCKSHRGRSTTNRSDALCIVEWDGSTTRAFATIIPDKKQTTILPIICSNIISRSLIHTDEHRSYRNISDHGFTHGTACHKYNFVDRTTVVHTQAVESFNNYIKAAIKKRMGVATEKCAIFLKEVCFSLIIEKEFSRPSLI